MDIKKFIEIGDKATEVALNRGFENLVGSQAVEMLNDIIIELFGEQTAKEYLNFSIENINNTGLNIERLISLHEDTEPLSFTDLEKKAFPLVRLDYEVYYEIDRLKINVPRLFENKTEGLIIANWLESRINTLEDYLKKYERKNRTRDKQPVKGIGVYEINIDTINSLIKKYKNLVQFINLVPNVASKTQNSPIPTVRSKGEGEKEKDLSFDTVFDSEESKLQTLEAAKKLGIIGDKHTWIYGPKKKAAIMAIIDVLKIREKLKDLPDIGLANIFAKKFNTTISERTTRARPKYYTDLLKKLKSMIK